jgi:uncharacterized repeat protein (TIGR03803 family)
MSKLSSWKTIFCVCVFCAVAAIASPAQTFTTLANFDGTDGVNPYAGLVQGTDGNFYGTTFQGGADGGYQGTVFKVTPAGTLTTLHSFAGTDGAFPYAGLIQGTDGNFYGTTVEGGANNNCTSGCGTVFKITLAGTLTTLHSFDGTDGNYPAAGLVQGTDGDFYGTTNVGGLGNNCADFQPTGCGTVFKITAAGTLTTLHTFNFTDGYEPWARLVQGTDGNFYGTTAEGVVGGDICGFGCGTVFKMTPAGTLTTLHAFEGPDGAFPQSALLQASNGEFYGTTAAGGAYDDCVPASFWCGTTFQITPTGTLTTVLSFDGADGSDPTAGLIQATDGNFYGTTTTGGANDTCPGCYGTAFKLTPEGTLTTLYSFCSQTDCADGAGPNGGVFQATNGTLYGTAFSGGAFNAGTVFSLSVGLGPFVEIEPTLGAVGAIVVILGNNLTGTTGVAFNGTAAAFEVLSSSEILTTVPTGATTGIVQVTTPSGTFDSNVAFQVTSLENTPQAQIAILENTLEALVSGGTISAGVGRLLLAQLNGALAALNAGHATEAIGELNGFIVTVRLLVILRQLTPAGGNILIDAAHNIITAVRG